MMTDEIGELGELLEQIRFMNYKDRTGFKLRVEQVSAFELLYYLDWQDHDANTTMHVAVIRRGVRTWDLGLVHAYWDNKLFEDEGYSYHFETLKEAKDYLQQLLVRARF